MLILQKKNTRGFFFFFSSQTGGDSFTNYSVGLLIVIFFSQNLFDLLLIFYLFSS